MRESSDFDILPLSLKHNFWTWSAQKKVRPIPIKSAKGVYFWDVNGKRYLDFNSMVMCVNIGHGDERVIEAIVRQARELPAQLGEPIAFIHGAENDHSVWGLQSRWFAHHGFWSSRNGSLSKSPSG